MIPVRACLIQGEDRSDVVTRTYVIGPDVKKRYDVYVASVVTDSYNLFDYDEGVMVAGSHYQKDVDKGVERIQFRRRGPSGRGCGSFDLRIQLSRSSDTVLQG